EPRRRGAGLHPARVRYFWRRRGRKSVDAERRHRSAGGDDAAHGAGKSERRSAPRNGHPALVLHTRGGDVAKGPRNPHPRILRAIATDRRNSAWRAGSPVADDGTDEAALGLRRPRRGADLWVALAK